MPLNRLIDPLPKDTPHPNHLKARYKIVKGFKWSRVLFEIQLHDQYLNVSVDHWQLPGKGNGNSFPTLLDASAKPSYIE